MKNTKINYGFLGNRDFGNNEVFGSIVEASYFAQGRNFVMFRDNKPISKIDVSKQMARIGYIILKKYIRHIGMADDIRVKEAISNKWRFWRREINSGEFELSICWINDIIFEKVQKKDILEKDMEKFCFLKNMLSVQTDISFSSAIEWYERFKNSNVIEKYLNMVFYKEWVKSQKTMFSDVMQPFSPI